MSGYGLAIMAVTEFVVTVLIFLFGGRWLDSHFVTGSKYMTIGVIIGFVIATIRMVIRLKSVMGDPSD
jgi:F0F1-type ATP synthase assembly protein I